MHKEMKQGHATKGLSSIHQRHPHNKSHYIKRRGGLRRDGLVWMTVNKIIGDLSAQSPTIKYEEVFSPIALASSFIWRCSAVPTVFHSSHCDEGRFEGKGGEREFLKEEGVVACEEVRERMRDKRGGDDSNAVSGGSREVPSAISAFHGGWNWSLINDGCRPFTNDLQFQLDAGLNGMLRFP
ncbi:hypothetical protein CEXT_796181 [Caerostris extrusa]|uniref:Uncharacterized protein n=1 Tax=Caerostris extrusa TaxID=172846 RepID=A0AAV4R4I9_CAEEX|nr:hypothetical protein CEXT_796181 [Caerostris extrusa]